MLMIEYKKIIYFSVLHFACQQDNIEIAKLFLSIPDKIDEILKNTNAIEEMADPLSSFRDFVYIANGKNFATATEGAQN